MERSRYYGVWILAEGPCILTGLGFTGHSPSGVPTWHGAANVDVWKFEIPENSKVLFDSWNMKTNVWLRECMYKRVTPKGKKAGFKSSMLTYLTSAVWVRGPVHNISSVIMTSLICGSMSCIAWHLSRILLHIYIGWLHHHRGSPMQAYDPPSGSSCYAAAHWPQAYQWPQLEAISGVRELGQDHI